MNVRIEKFGSPGPQSGLERENAVHSGKPDGSFLFDLTKTQDKHSDERLQTLLAKIDEQGQRLCQSPTYSELKSYRELVRDFLGEVISRAYTMQSQHGWDHRGRQKVYSVIKNIDGKLAGLAEDIRDGQAKQLSIMEKLDAIRGMLVDLHV